MVQHAEFEPVTTEKQRSQPENEDDTQIQLPIVNVKAVMNPIISILVAGPWRPVFEVK